MPKVLSQSGNSLADVYDVEGSIAGIEELLSKDVNLVHEMGSTIFSERLSARMIALSSGALAQSLEWDINFSFAEHTRILAVQVVTATVARVNQASVALLSGAAVDDMEVPIWAWDANEGSVVARVLIGGAVATQAVLISPIVPQVPSMLTGNDAPRPASTVSFRGGTTAFGAGTVITQALIYGLFPQVAGLSSRGLPIPGW